MCVCFDAIEHIYVEKDIYYDAVATTSYIKPFMYPYYTMSLRQSQNEYKRKNNFQIFLLYIHNTTTTITTVALYYIWPMRKNENDKCNLPKKEVTNVYVTSHSLFP